MEKETKKKSLNQWFDVITRFHIPHLFPAIFWMRCQKNCDKWKQREYQLYNLNAAIATEQKKNKLINTNNFHCVSSWSLHWHASHPPIAQTIIFHRVRCSSPLFGSKNENSASTTFHSIVWRSFNLHVVCSCVFVPFLVHRCRVRCAVAVDNLSQIKFIVSEQITWLYLAILSPSSFSFMIRFCRCSYRARRTLLHTHCHDDASDA